MIERGRIDALQLEHDGVGRRCLDRVDAFELSLARGGDALRRIAQTVERRLDVGGGQLAAVVEFHAGLQLEGVSEPIRRHRPGIGEIADDLGKVVGVVFEQRRIMRRQHLQRERGRGRMAIETRRLAFDDMPQNAAALRRLCGKRRLRRRRQLRCRQDFAQCERYVRIRILPCRASAARLRLRFAVPFIGTLFPYSGV